MLPGAFSRRMRSQKNGGRKMTVPRLALYRGAGVYYLSDPDISDILFGNNRKWILRELPAGKKE
jgi:hypothetical protein